MNDKEINIDIKKTKIYSGSIILLKECKSIFVDNREIIKTAKKLINELYLKKSIVKLLKLAFLLS